MDSQILGTIQDFYGDLSGRTTDSFYEHYCYICTLCNVEPRPKNVVIREACDVCGVKTKQKTYTVFCEDD